MLSQLQVRCAKQTQKIKKLEAKNKELDNTIKRLQDYFKLSHAELALIIYQNNL